MCIYNFVLFYNLKQITASMEYNDRHGMDLNIHINKSM